MKKAIVYISCIFFLLISCKEKSSEKIALNTIENQQQKFKVETVVSDLEIPWGMVFLPDGAMLVTERKGELIHFKGGIKTLVKNVPEVYFEGQGGLLDIELHPNYAENGWIYFSYSSSIGNNKKGGNTTIMRAKFDNFELTDKEILYKATPNTTRGVHFGSRIEFDNAGFLYFSVGDRGNRDVNPQDLTRDGGKIYRLHDDGSIPKNNPFFNVKNAKTGVFSYGHRNPQGMAKHPVTGKIWVHEHGPKGGDEINIINAGKNYGWPVISYGINYNGTKFTDKTEQAGMEQPFHHWTPSIAPSGMAFVTSKRYPAWKGNILVGSLKFQYLNRVEIKNNKVIKEEKLLEGLGRVRCIRQAPDGLIYVAIEHKGIVKIVPKN